MDFLEFGNAQEEDYCDNFKSLNFILLFDFIRLCANVIICLYCVIVFVITNVSFKKSPLLLPQPAFTINKYSLRIFFSLLLDTLPT